MRRALRISVLGAAAAFTALVFHRASPVQLHGGRDGAETRLVDGTVIKVAPGGRVDVVRNFALWGGNAARPRLVRWMRGTGRIETGADVLPFHLVTPEARFDVVEGIFDVAHRRADGTQVRVEQGRMQLTARDPADPLNEVLAATGSTALVESGRVVHVQNGAIDVVDDVR